MYAGNRWRFDYRESSIAVPGSGWCMLGTCRDLSEEKSSIAGSWWCMLGTGGD